MRIDELIAALMEAPLQVPLADDVVLENFGQSMAYHGRQAVTAVLRAYFEEGFSESSINPHASLSNERTLVLAFTFCGRQTGLFMGIPATDRRVRVPMLLLCQIERGRLAHIYWYYDAGTILRQLGLATMPHRSL